jgi:hypothetical protein
MKQTAGRSAKSYRESGWKIQVHLNTIKKELTKMVVHHKVKKIHTENHSTSTIRHQSNVEALDAKLFLCKIHLQMCIR